MATWPETEVVDWPSPPSPPQQQQQQQQQHGEVEKKLALPAQQGGVWTGVVSPSLDGFPFVGPAPDRDGHFLAAGFGGHGMPRILLSTAHLAPLVLDSLAVAWSAPALVEAYPPMPQPFVVTAERVAALRRRDARAEYEDEVKGHEEAAKKEYCNGPRSLHWKGRL